MSISHVYSLKSISLWLDLILFSWSLLKMVFPLICSGDPIPFFYCCWCWCCCLFVHQTVYFPLCFHFLHLECVQNCIEHNETSHLCNKNQIINVWPKWKHSMNAILAVQMPANDFDELWLFKLFHRTPFHLLTHSHTHTHTLSLSLSPWISCWVAIINDSLNDQQHQHHGKMTIFNFFLLCTFQRELRMKWKIWQLNITCHYSAPNVNSWLLDVLVTFMWFFSAAFINTTINLATQFFIIIANVSPFRSLFLQTHTLSVSVSLYFSQHHALVCIRKLSKFCCSKRLNTQTD